MKHSIPSVLILTRLVLGLILVPLSLAGIGHYQTIAVCILVAGLLTDVFDGIIARKLQISTTKLRRLDSTVDQVFFISFAVATCIQCPGFFKDNLAKLAILSGAEAFTYLLCFFKFKKEVATHTIGAKCWTLLLVAALLQVTVQCNSNLLFTLCFWVGLATRFEIILIIFLLRSWTHDVPSVYHAIQSRRGKEMRRHKLFNG